MRSGSTRSCSASPAVATTRTTCSRTPGSASRAAHRASISAGARDPGCTGSRRISRATSIAGAGFACAAQRRLVRLPDRLREVLVLRFYDDLDEAEMAEALGIPKGTVKSRLHGAIRELRRGWEGA